MRVRARANKLNLFFFTLTLTLKLHTPLSVIKPIRYVDVSILTPFPDQWEFLRSINRVKVEVLNDLEKELSSNPIQCRSGMVNRFL